MTISSSAPKRRNPRRKPRRLYVTMSMKNLFHAAAACVGLLTLAVPAAGIAATSAPAAHYSTSMTALFGSAVPYSGSLDLTVNPDGIVRGYYFPADQSSMYVPVVGGRTGDRIWFDIGSTGSVHIDGRFERGTIVGTAFDRSNGQFSFVASPVAKAAR